MGQVGSWDALVVASLIRSKRAGVPFDSAWAIATREHRPRARDVFTPEGGRLFSDDVDEQDESVADALYRFAADAWHGRNPRLRHFSLEMLRDEPGDSRVNDGLGKLAA